VKKITLPRIIAALAGITLVGAGIWTWKNPKPTPDQINQASEEKTSQPIKEAPAEQKKRIDEKNVYTDDSYFKTGEYLSPAGAETIDLSLTLKNDIITDAQLTGRATHPASKKWQETFVAGYKEKVIGKPLRELSLVAVSGASLTTKGFMDAVKKIKQQAEK
jgi:uncharacterized protein with FMN-binding domain